MSKRLWLAGGLGAAVTTLGWTGWLTPLPAPETATGWNTVPVAERPAPGPLWTADGGTPPPTIAWLGHAGFVIDWGGRRLVVDPNASSRCSIARRVLHRGPALAAAVLDLGRVDAVLISHAHYDHLDLPTLRRLRGLGTVVVPAGSERFLGDIARRPGVTVRGLAIQESIAFGPLEVVAVPARHNGHRHHPFASREHAAGYVVRFAGEALYIAGDTGFGDGASFRRLRARFRPRAAILPIGAYAPRWPLARYHLAPEEAVKAARLLGVETVMPSHFGTFTLSLDRPDWALRRFAHAAAEAGVSWRMPRLLGAAREPR